MSILDRATLKNIPALKPAKTDFNENDLFDFSKETKIAYCIKSCPLYFMHNTCRAVKRRARSKRGKFKFNRAEKMEMYTGIKSKKKEMCGIDRDNLINLMGTYLRKETL
jgi:hypothetical protein